MSRYIHFSNAEKETACQTDIAELLKKTAKGYIVTVKNHIGLTEHQRYLLRVTFGITNTRESEAMPLTLSVGFTISPIPKQ